MIVVFRDLLAITGRRQVSRHSPMLQEMTTAIREHQRLVRFIGSIDAPTLLISYEKALLDPTQLVSQLDRFLDLTLDPGQRRRSAERVEPSPDLYRREVRLPLGWLGRLETVRSDHIAGWAFRDDTSTGPGVRVEIFVNGKLLGRIPTTKTRLDVQQDHHLRSDRCGFCVDLRAPSLLKPGDVVAVKVEGEQEQLLNSPWRLGDSPP